MTSPPDIHRVASAIAEESLAAVFDPTLVRALRPDSPLAAIGLVDADLVALADAVHVAAASRGVECVLDDPDLADLTTVADLVRAIESKDPS